MKITIHRDRTKKNHDILNIEAHHMTFKKWWAEVSKSWVTMSASKYCSVPRRAFGVYVIEGPADCIHQIYMAFTQKHGRA